MVQLLDWRGFYFLAWIGRVLLAIAVGIVLLQSDIGNSLSLLIFFLASLVPLVFGKKLPHFFNFLLVLAAIINAGAWIWRFYDTLFFYDEVTHLYTTFALTFAIGYLMLTKLKKTFVNHTLLLFLTVTTFGITLGTLWEIYEWTMGFFIEGQIIKSLRDTIIDLLLDALGALVAAAMTFLLLPKSQKDLSTL